MSKRDIFGDLIEETDEEMMERWQHEADMADAAYAEMHEHCYGCEFYRRIGCDRDIDEYPECPRDIGKTE